MVDEKQIGKWVEDGTITKKQAEKMLADDKEYSKEKSSNKIISIVSIIGSVLIGLGAITYIAANWGKMHDVIKTLIMVALTLASYYTGYMFAYEKKNYPRVGRSLMFLGALLFGSTIFLIAQIYNINANSHTLLLIWLIGVLPLVYALRSRSLAVLSSLIFIAWLGFYTADILSMGMFSGGFGSLPVIFLLGGLILFGFGGINYTYGSLKGIARTFRLLGIKTILIALFFLTLRWVHGFTWRDTWEATRWAEGTLSNLVLALAVIAAITLIGNYIINSKRLNTIVLESIVGGILLISSVMLTYVQLYGQYYWIFFNIFFAGLMVVLIIAGFRREDIALVNLGLFWVGLFLVVKYYDFFWNYMDKSLFFTLGGLILLFGGISLEKKRRKIKTDFKKSIDNQKKNEK